MATLAENFLADLDELSEGEEEEQQEQQEQGGEGEAERGKDEKVRLVWPSFSLLFRLALCLSIAPTTISV